MMLKHSVVLLKLMQMNNSETYRRRRAQRPRRPSQLTKGVSLTVLLVIVAFGVMFWLSKALGEEPATIGGEVTADCLTTVELPDETNEIIINYTGFKVSFNPVHHQPNYVAWELTGAETEGMEPRESKFKADSDVYGCATLEDYRRSGYDRGHMAPAGDMKWSAQAMEDSHYLTNICPQDHSINSGRWSTLEKKCRQWAVRDSAIIIICGPVLTDIMPNTIGRSQVSVPERFFKIVLAPYAEPPRAIGFIMPNHPTPDGLESMATSVDNIEQITGFDFFKCLPDDIENEIESKSNYRLWDKKRR